MKRSVNPKLNTKLQIANGLHNLICDLDKHIKDLKNEEDTEFNISTGNSRPMHYHANFVNKLFWPCVIEAFEKKKEEIQKEFDALWK